MVEKEENLEKLGAKTNLFKDLSKIYRNSLNLMEKTGQFIILQI